ncbi:MAG: hypothetical protein HWN80_05245 [Candidatus Lokiarchaeota archaeon]|nr:hypothetical protein [Candidatus Lokiarchaeota archaeon]
MKKLEKKVKFLPFIGYLGFFLMQVIIGLLLISGLLPSVTTGLIDPPLYQPLTYFDLIILLAMNIPTFIIVVIAFKKIREK